MAAASFIIQQEVTFHGKKQRHFIFPTKPEETVCWPLNYRDNDSLALGIMGPVFTAQTFPSFTDSDDNLQVWPTQAGHTRTNYHFRTF